MMQPQYLDKHAQIAIEFIIITGVVLFFFVGFMIIINNNISDAKKARENTFMKDLALSVRDEVGLAAHASNGYSRTFTVPASISGTDYEINITENVLQLKTTRNAIALVVENVTGNVNKGSNFIRKINNVVFLN